MNRPWLTALRPVAAPLAVLALHAAALRALDAMQVVARVLGAAVPNVGLLVLLALFYALRLVAIFVAPGWLVAGLLRAAIRLRRARRADRAGTTG